MWNYFRTCNSTGILNSYDLKYELLFLGISKKITSQRYVGYFLKMS